MSVFALIDWQLPMGQADALPDAAWRDEPIGDLRLGLAAAVACWLFVLAPLFA